MSLQAHPPLWTLHPHQKKTPQHEEVELANNQQTRRQERRV